jgi:hypothetical protein
MSAALASFLAQAQLPTEGRTGFWLVGNWVVPCELLDRQLKGETLTKPAEAKLATLCEGAMFAIISGNYFKPPYLPFCTDVHIARLHGHHSGAGAHSRQEARRLFRAAPGAGELRVRHLA